MKQIHLICNAHLDPVWLWRWEEGVTEALSTFRTAVELTDEFSGFVFNHNEAILYEWVKENEPSLFDGIKAKVAEGKWHIMGGWYLQPDCNMPAGESIIRNIQLGRRFFKHEFRAKPTTAINFDSFGHSRGLVQILTKSGFDAYIICRAGKYHKEMLDQDFLWKGLDGSIVNVHRSDENYNSVLGHAAEELESFVNSKADEEVTLYLWGVGDHGGGPSRKDLADLREIFKSRGDVEFIHSTPEAYFDKLRELKKEYLMAEEGLNSVADGCYTSQLVVKQKHRRLENELYSAEKMLSAAAVQTGLPYPADKLAEAERDLVFSEFHDALPGSGSELVEEDTIRLLDHGLETLAREKVKAVVALSRGEEKVKEGCSTVVIYNPHPFEYDGIVAFEATMPSQNWEDVFYYPRAYINDRPVPTQCEKELNNFAIDWRKMSVIRAKLPASSITRVDLRFEPRDKRPTFKLIADKSEFVFDNGRMRVRINTSTGLIDEYTVDGENCVQSGSFRICSYDDSFNPWGMCDRGKHGRREFVLMTNYEASEISALGYLAPAVRVIEDGEVRMVVEALFKLGKSAACVRYKLPKEGSQFDIEANVFFAEKEKYLKLEIDTPLAEGKYTGQIIFGREELHHSQEVVSQKWSSMEYRGAALSVMGDGGYGSSVRHGTLGITMMRGAAHTAAHNRKRRALGELRWTTRMDQGMSTINYRINAGKAENVMRSIDNTALVFNEKLYCLSYNPPGTSEKVGCFITIDNENVVLSAFKRSLDYDDEYIVRMYEARGEGQCAIVDLPSLGMKEKVCFEPFEIKTYKLNIKNRSFFETSMIEE